MKRIKLRSINIDPALHRVLKSASAELDRGMTQIAHESLERYLKQEMGEEVFKKMYDRASSSQGSASQGSASQAEAA